MKHLSCYSKPGVSTVLFCSWQADIEDLKPYPKWDAFVREIFHRPVAQFWLERYLDTVEVSGSSPLGPTRN